jgi:hypothetical protein
MFRRVRATQVGGAREAQRSNAPWAAADIPDQTDRVAVITGVGFETATALASHGAQVVLAVPQQSVRR